MTLKIEIRKPERRRKDTSPGRGGDNEEEVPPLTKSHPQARGDNVHNHDKNTVEEDIELEYKTSDIMESSEIQEDGVDDEEATSQG